MNEKHIKGILKNVEDLETSIGYRTLSSSASNHVTDSYHSKTVWPFEQAIIHNSGRRFGLDRIVEISGRIKSFIFF